MFKISDIGPNDYVVVLCDKIDGDECYFPVPGTKDHVWVARVKEIVSLGHDTYKITGWFLWNDARNLTHPFMERSVADPIDFHEEAVVGVFEFEEGFRLTKANVAEVVRSVRKLD